MASLGHVQLRVDHPAELVLYPTLERDGQNWPVRASSAELALHHGGDSVYLAADTATADAGSESVTSATATSRTLTLAATTDYVVGRRYLLESSGGRRIECELVDKTASTVELDAAPGVDVTGWTLYGWAIRRSLTAEQLATVARRLRAVWTYTADGATSVIEDHLVDVVERPFRLGLSLGDLEGVEPGFRSLLGRSATGRWRHRAAEAERLASAWLRSEQVEPDWAVEDTTIRRAAAWWTLELMTMREGEGLVGASAHGRFRKKREGLCAQYLRSRVWVDKNADLVVDAGGTGGGVYVSDGAGGVVELESGSGLGVGGVGAGGPTGELGAGPPLATLRIS